MGKIIANILRFLGRRESKLVRKNSKKLPKLFHYGFAENFFKQKRPECPFKDPYLFPPQTPGNSGFLRLSRFSDSKYGKPTIRVWA